MSQGNVELKMYVYDTPAELYATLARVFEEKFATQLSNIRWVTVMAEGMEMIFYGPRESAEPPVAT